MADIKPILDGAQVPPTVKADAWDAFQQSGSQQDFQARFDKLALPKETKAALWDAKFGQAPAAAAPPDKPSIGGFLKNAANSAGNFVGDVAGAVTHPGRTLEGVTGLMEGMAEKTGFTPVAGVSHQQNVDALTKMYKDRYGSLDNFTHTLYTDPVSVLADVASVAGATGLAARGVKGLAEAGGMARTADVAGTVAKTAGTVADVTDPLALPAKAAGAVVSKLPERWYQSALKPSTALPTSKVQSIVRTGLENRIPVSAGGSEKLGGLIDDLNDKIKAQIQAGAGRGVTIDPNAVAARLDDLRKRFGSQVNPDADLKAIDASRAEFLGGPGAGPIPADLAQSIKQGTYQQLKGKAYGELKSATVESQKALARGIKEELASAIPEIGDLNSRESKLIGLDSVLERAVRRIDNHQLTGIGTPIVAAGVGATTGSTKMAMAAGIMRAVVENPEVKSKLAIAMKYAQGRTPAYAPMKPAAISSRIQDYIESLSTPNAQPATGTAQ